MWKEKMDTTSNLFDELKRVDSRSGIWIGKRDFKGITINWICMKQGIFQSYAQFALKCFCMNKNSFHIHKKPPQNPLIVWFNRGYMFFYKIVLFWRGTKYWNITWMIRMKWEPQYISSFSGVNSMHIKAQSWRGTISLFQQSHSTQICW